MRSYTKWVIAISLAAVLLCGLCGCRQENPEAPESRRSYSEEYNHFCEQKIDGETYLMLDDDYGGDYRIQTIALPDLVYPDLLDNEAYQDFSYHGVMSLDEYAAFCSERGLTQAYTDEGFYAVEIGRLYGDTPDVRLGGVTVEGDTMTLYRRVHTEIDGDPNDMTGYVIVVPTDASATYVRTENLYLPEDLIPAMTDAKPILYLYPEKETELTVTLGCPEKLSCVYPAYNGGWRVLAAPDGTLTDLATGRNLYALYWEGRNADFEMTDEGFCVAGCDTAAFLEEKLALLGLNEREAEEMIVYWLPQMEDNAYNYIRFASAEEIENYMPLDFSAQPDSIIRVNMIWKALDAPIEVTGQKIKTPARYGFVAVEWGGCDLSNR